MKKITVLSLSLLLSGVALAGLSGKAATTPSDDSVQIFWQKFKAAVSAKKVEAVANLSKFPIEMSYGIASIRNKSQLRRRYREVFNEQTDAAKCFAKAQPEIDTANRKRFTVACPDAAGNEVVIYHFLQTRSGWKFTGLDNLNE
ncbi:MAG TPA: hypothetical protein VM911_13660 [Pyrinomonadaceae bacterium]|jgi:hypothetical protein|nr:hypothetical protein [Pyrinomonadaceae bacterium]